MAMLSCSALYHMRKHHRHRDWLQRLDHAAIFVMIAGTYTPLAMLGLAWPWDAIVTSSVWAVALFGIVLKLIRSRAVEPLSVALYLAQGWMGLLVLDQLVASVPTVTLLLIVVGGLVYSGGVILHLSSRRYSLPLWHGCVLLGAAVHYVAIATLIRP